MALDQDAERAVIRGAIPRIYADPNCTPRRLLEQLELGPRSSKDLSAFLKTKGHGTDADFVRKEIANARKFIDAFHLGPNGFADRYKMYIPNLEVKGGSYRLTVVPNIPPKNAGGFWAAHLSNGKPTQIITGRPEFVQEKETGVLYRHEFLDGHSGEMIKILRETNPELQDGEINKVQPFISVSDVRAMLSIFSYLDSWRRNYNHLPPELLCTEADIKRGCANLITLGTPFDNRRIQRLEGQVAMEECRGRTSCYMEQDGLGFQKQMPNGEYRVWVHRYWSKSHCETVVNASTSEALAPVCNFLTSDEAMEAAIKELWSKTPWTGYPPEFRIQFRVRLEPDGVTTRKVQIQQYIEITDWATVEELASDTSFVDTAWTDSRYRIEEGAAIRTLKTTLPAVASKGLG